MKKWSLLIYILFNFLILANASSITIEEKELLNKTLNQLIPNFDINKIIINNFPELNFYQLISTENLEVFWISKDARYFFYGDLLDTRINNKRERNLTENGPKKIRKEKILNLDKKDMIIFKPDHNLWGLRKPLSTITVVTDLTCPYGNNFHKEALKAVAAGVEVRYLLFPRNGLDSEAYKKAVAVWCSKNRNKAFTLATEGKDPEAIECNNNPIKKHFDFAKKIGVKGTPSIFLIDGSIVPGYVSSESLLKLIKEIS